MMALPQQRADVLLGRAHCNRLPYLHEDRQRGAGVGLVDAEHHLLGGGQRDRDDVVLVLPLRGLPLAGEYAESRQPRMLISVDLPDPDGPMMANNSPASTVTDTPRRLRTT
jgi:hypothetical protein